MYKKIKDTKKRKSILVWVVLVTTTSVFHQSHSQKTNCESLKTFQPCKNASDQCKWYVDFANNLKNRCVKFDALPW